MSKKNFRSFNSNHIIAVCNLVFQAYESVLKLIGNSSPCSREDMEGFEESLIASPEVIEQAGKHFHDLILHTKNGYQGYAVDGLRDWLRPLHVTNQVVFAKFDLPEILSERLLQILELEQAISVRHGRYLYRATLNHLLFKAQDAFACDGIDDLEADRLVKEYIDVCQHVVELCRKVDDMPYRLSAPQAEGS